MKKVSSENNSGELKKLVLEKYDRIGQTVKSGSDQNAGCGTGCCDTVNFEVFADDYSSIEGYNADADLGLGCGLPTEHAKIKPSDIVVDLGSGAGNDCFVARQLTGESGKVIGIDFSPTMIERARINADKLGFENVEFYQGDIEEMPLDDNVADVVVSNCVMNLVPDKERAFSETFRILKAGGHFSISDVVTVGELPPGVKKDAELFAGCVSGATDLDKYLEIVKSAGFQNLNIQKKREINVPDEVLEKTLSSDEIEELKSSGVGIYSITLYAEKP